MPKLSLTVPHNLGDAEAARRIREHYDAMKNHHQDKIRDLEERWEGNTLHCRFQTLGVKVAGTVRAEPKSVAVDAELPMMAAMFKGMIERQIRAELGKLLA